MRRDVARPQGRAFLFWLSTSFAALSLGCGGDPASPATNLVAGQSGELEFAVAAVKYAPRRETYFLSSSTNFRGAGNQIVALRAKDWKIARDKGLEQLEQRYYGKRIRVRGVVEEEEGQVLLVIDGVERIEVVPDQGPGNAPQLQPHRSKHSESGG